MKHKLKDNPFDFSQTCEYCRKRFTMVDLLQNKEQEECSGSPNQTCVKCECGADKCKAPYHSDWCPKHT